MFIKIFLRSVRRKFSFFFIKVTGLSLALSLGVLVLFFVKSELEYDQFHKDSNQIYKTSTYLGFRGGMISEGTPFLLASSLLENIPEVELSTHMVNLGKMEMNVDAQTHSTDVHLVDTSFLKVFDFSILRGDPKTALNDPKSVIISERLAIQLFGESDPLNKTLNIHLSEQDKKLFNVAAIAKNVPENSSISFDLLISDENAYLFMGDATVKNWIPYKSNVLTFFKAKANAKESQIITGLNQIAESHGIPERLNSVTQKEKFPIMKLNEVHFHNDADITFLKEKGNLNYLYVLVSVSGLILLIAAMNFTNLSLGLSIIRSKEVGVRKVLGSTKSSLIKQFMLESTTTVFISLVIGIVLAYMCLPYFNSMLDKNLSFNFIEEPISILLLIFIGVLTAILAGIYPAFVISSQQTITSLQGKISLKHKWLPNSITTFQFGISMMLVIIALGMQSQLAHITNHDLGFNKEYLIYQTFDFSKSPSDMEVQRFSNEAIKHLGVLGVSGTRGGLIDNEPETLWSVERNGETLTIPSIKIGYDFIPTMEIQLVEGRNFSASSPSDLDGIIVNQEFIDVFEIENPVGHAVDLGNQKPIIVGVVTNFRFNSLRDPVRPLILNLRPGSPNTAMLIRIDGNQISSTIEYLKQRWKETARPDVPFSYHFFEDDLERQYKAESSFRAVVGYASFFAVITALIGLIGLTSLNIIKRLKEISLRRVLGAELHNVMFLFVKETSKLIGLSAIIFWPLSFIYLESWLGNFNVRATQNPFIYLGIGMVVTTIAAILIFFQVRKTSLGNPANVLKSE